MSLESRSSYNYGDDSSSVVKLYTYMHINLENIIRLQEYAHPNYSIKTNTLHLNKNERSAMRW